jgi:hypothetical protein
MPIDMHAGWILHQPFISGSLAVLSDILDVAPEIDVAIDLW